MSFNPSPPADPYASLTSAVRPEPILARWNFVAGFDTSGLRFLTAPTSGYVLVSDAYGNFTPAAVSGLTFLDSTWRLLDDGDNTKKLAFQLSGFTTGTTRTLTPPNASGTIGTLENSGVYTAAQYFGPTTSRSTRLDVTGVFMRWSSGVGNPTPTILWSDDDGFTGTLTPGVLTANRVWTPPNATTTLAGLAVQQTFTQPQIFSDGTLAVRLGDGAGVGSPFYVEVAGAADSWLWGTIKALDTGNAMLVSLSADPAGGTFFTIPAAGGFALVSLAPLTSGRVPFVTTGGVLTNDADLTFSGGNTLNATNLVVATALKNTALTSGRVVFTTTGGQLTDDADMTFATDTLSATKVAMSSLTSGRVPFASAAGLLVDDADLTFATDTLTATKIVGTTSVKAGTAAGFISSDGSTGATGTFTTVDLKTVTVKDGIITSIV